MFGIKKEELVWSVFFFFNFMTFSCLGIVEAEPFVTETKTVKETPQVTNNKRKFPDDREIRIAWMAPEAEYHNFSAATSVGTLKMGLSFIENEKSLHGRTIRVKWYDTKCDSKAALWAAVDAVKNFDPDVFIGPPCSEGLFGVAQLAAHWNLPVFSWVSDSLEDKDNNTYTTLIRLSGKNYAFSRAVTEVLQQYFPWNNVVLIYDKQRPYESLASALREYADDSNLTIRSSHYITSKTMEEDIRSILMQMKKYTRVIVFAVPWHALRRYLLIAEELGMADGEFAFICVTSDLFAWDVMRSNIQSDWGWNRNDTQDNRARKAYESVIHIIRKPFPERNYEQFNKHSAEAGQLRQPSWDLPTSNMVMFNKHSAEAGQLRQPSWDLPTSNTTPDAYAPYLYDALLVWAGAVNLTLEMGGDPRDGTLIRRMVPSVTTSSVTDQIVFYEPEMDRIQNFQVLDMNENGTFYKLYEFVFKKDVDGKPYASVNMYSEEKFKTKGRWNTLDGRPPPDIPVCGFDSEKCAKKEACSCKHCPTTATELSTTTVTEATGTQQSKGLTGSTAIGLSAAVAALLLIVIAIVVAVLILRHKRRQQESERRYKHARSVVWTSPHPAYIQVVFANYD